MGAIALILLSRGRLINYGQQAKVMRILVAGGTAVSRRAIITLIETNPQLEIVGDVATLEEIGGLASLANPELVLLDCDYFMEPIYEIQTFIQDIEAKPSLLILSGRNCVKKAVIPTGAVFVLKGDPPKSLLTAVETIRLKRQDV